MEPDQDLKLSINIFENDCQPNKTLYGTLRLPVLKIMDFAKFKIIPSGYHWVWSISFQFIVGSTHDTEVVGTLRLPVLKIMNFSKFKIISSGYHWVWSLWVLSFHFRVGVTKKIWGSPSILGPEVGCKLFEFEFEENIHFLKPFRNSK